MSTGMQGSFGPFGAQGPTGIQGPHGRQGIYGPAGSDGQVGANGPTGQQLYGNGSLVQNLYVSLATIPPGIPIDPTPVPISPTGTSAQPSMLLNESRSISGYYTFTGGTGFHRYEDPLALSNGFTRLAAGTYYVSVSINPFGVDNSYTSQMYYIDISEVSGETYTSIATGPITPPNGSCHLTMVYQPQSPVTIAVSLIPSSTDWMLPATQHTTISFVRLW